MAKLFDLLGAPIEECSQALAQISLAVILILNPILQLDIDRDILC